MAVQPDVMTEAWTALGGTGGGAGIAGVVDKPSQIWGQIG